MASHPVVDGGVGFQIQHVVADVLNKLLQGANKAVCSNWGFSTDG